MSGIEGDTSPPFTVIEAIEDGPLHVKGALEVVGATNGAPRRVDECWLCRCGQSARKPFCDGTHKRIGFEAPGVPPRKREA